MDKYERWAIYGLVAAGLYLLYKAGSALGGAADVAAGIVPDFLKPPQELPGVTDPRNAWRDKTFPTTGLGGMNNPGIVPGTAPIPGELGPVYYGGYNPATQSIDMSFDVIADPYSGAK